MMEKVTVIIVTFNSAKTLRVAIDSVLNQTYENVECLVIDGASKDGTVDILNEYRNRITFVSEPDKGIYDAFNKGWKMATGEWIMYLGSDDFYFKDGISKLLSISNNDVDVLYGDCELRFNRTKKIRGNTPLSQIGYRLPACHQSMAMRRSLIKELGGFNMQYKVYADLDIVQRAYNAGARFACTDEVISSFYVGGVSADNLKASKELSSLIKSNGIETKPRFRMFLIILKTLVLKVYHFFK